MKKVFTFVLCMAAAIISGTLNAQKRMKTTDKEQMLFTHVDVKSLKSHTSNPFGLVYGDALTDNIEGRVNILIDLFAFDASEGMYLINQPLLMMAGSIADTFYMTEQCYSKATGTNDKELFLIPGATHIQTYWKTEYVNQAVAKLAEFFGKRL